MPEKERDTQSAQRSTGVLPLTGQPSGAAPSSAWVPKAYAIWWPNSCALTSWRCSQVPVRWYVPSSMRPSVYESDVVPEIYPG